MSLRLHSNNFVLELADYIRQLKSANYETLEYFQH